MISLTQRMKSFFKSSKITGHKPVVEQPVVEEDHGGR